MDTEWDPYVRERFVIIPVPKGWGDNDDDGEVPELVSSDDMLVMHESMSSKLIGSQRVDVAPKMLRVDSDDEMPELVPRRDDGFLFQTEAFNTRIASITKELLDK